MQESTSYNTINIDSNVPNEPATSSSIYIASSEGYLQDTHSMECNIPPNLQRLQSENKQRVLNCLKEKITKELSAIEQEICIEDICFEEERTKSSQQQHMGHQTMRLSELVKKLEILKCNHHFTLAEPAQVISLLDDLDDIYNQIVRFELQIMKLFSKIKTQAVRHISQVKQSFQAKHYQTFRAKLTRAFTYPNVKYALAEIDKFHSLTYPNLQYPSFKLNNMKNRIAKANVNNKVIAVQAINGWIERLLALEKKDSRVIFNRSISTFMNKSTCEQIVFSYYLKSEEYRVDDGHRLKRVDFSSNSVPFAAVEKELLPETTVKFRITQIGEFGGMFLGVTPMSVLRKEGCDNLIKHEGSYFLTNRGHILSHKSCNTSSSLPFGAKDEVWIRREKNSIVWKRRKEGGYEQQVRINLTLKQCSEHFYVCVHLEDRESGVELMD